jgi:hypothetical protein
MISIACCAQTVPVQSALVSLDEQHRRGVEQNPPGVALTITTADGGSTYRRSDTIRIKLSFGSRQLHRYTVELSKGNAATASNNFVVQGPGITVPAHSMANHPVAYVCCDSRRRYLGHFAVAPEVNLNLNHVEEFAYTFNLPNASVEHHKLGGDYAIFAQTRNIMKGWPKTPRDSYHAASDIVVTSSNILHITVLPDAP